MKKKSIIAILIFVIFAILLMNKAAYAASDFSYDKMDFDVEVNSDGSMDVIETWTVDIHGETNTLFKNFELDKTKFSNITDVSVVEVNSAGTEKEFDEINEEMYHVTTNDFYAMKVSGNKFEIAWGVNKSSGTKTYRMYYTVNDCVKVYNDCTDLCWKFVNNTEGQSVDKVTGTIKLPKEVSDIENLKVWGHGDVDGEVIRKDEETITFSSKDYNSEYLEVRIVTTENIYSQADEIDNEKLEKILSYEKNLADKANHEKMIRRILGVVMVVIIYLINILITVLYINKKKPLLKEVPKKVPTQVYDYYRDFPREDATPGQVAFLHYYNTGTMQGNKAGQAAAATILDLGLKKYIEFEIDPEKRDGSKEKVRIRILTDMDEKQLKESESIVYDLLKSVGSGKDTFTMKDFEKYASVHEESVYSKMNMIAASAKAEHCDIKNYDEESAKVKTTCNVVLALIFALMVFQYIFGIAFLGIFNPGAILFLLPVGIITVYNMIIIGKVGNRFDGLTQKGIDEKEQLRALKRYMEDFSLLKDREVPELVLWEKYLVYATTMGIADKVLKQLKVVYPNLETDTSLSNTSILYMATRGNMGNSFISTINSSTNKAYLSSTPSSSSGGGGGFSGGGGFGGGGGCSGGR